MSYITTAERIGREEGVHQGESTLLMSLLKCKFGTVIPQAYLSRINAADEQMILTWAQRCLNASALEAVFLEQ